MADETPTTPGEETATEATAGETAASTDATETTETTEAAETPAAEQADASADEAAAAAEADAAEAQQRVTNPAADARYQATGKRKTSVARVIVTPGDGGFWINGRSLDEYFPRFASRNAVLEPLSLIGATGSYNVRARIHGGGISSQAGALRHGISRALAEIHPTVRTQLKGKGLLKLDARQVERKKAGLKKARKKPQFSKR